MYLMGGSNRSSQLILTKLAGESGTKGGSGEAVVQKPYLDDPKKFDIKPIPLDKGSRPTTIPLNYGEIQYYQDDTEMLVDDESTPKDYAESDANQKHRITNPDPS